MKQLFTLLLISSSFLLTCEKESLNDVGVITSFDSRECGCCGGWFIEIDGETHRFFELPKNSGLDLENEALPIDVKLNWEKEDDSCMGDLILVSKMEKL
ncbi:MAG: hypothetical protein ACPGVB_09935 [Chitinophagales bacterium]